MSMFEKERESVSVRESVVSGKEDPAHFKVKSSAGLMLGGFDETDSEEEDSSSEGKHFQFQEARNYNSVVKDIKNGHKNGFQKL